MKSRAALVTGASRGIGKAIALELGRCGYNVLVGCKTNVGLAEETANEICRFGGRADIIQADVSKEEEVQKILLFARKTFGFTDTIVCNAGICRYATITEEDASGFDEIVGVNFKGVFNVIRAFVPDMISNKFGRIINISSMWGVMGASCEALYSATKAAVIGLTTSLARELGPSGITVNAVAPGAIRTDMLKNMSEETLKSLAGEAAVGRIGEPQDVANAVRFLADERSEFVTGEILNCSGGFITYN